VQNVRGLTGMDGRAGTSRPHVFGATRSRPCMPETLPL